jgi:hypothetical protein
MKPIEIIANVIGIAAVITFVSSYQLKKRRAIVTCNVISRALYVLQYLLLGAFEGAALDVMGVLASVLAQNMDKGVIKKHRTAFIIGINALIVTVGLLLYESPVSLLPIAGILLQTGAFWFRNERVIRRLSFIGSPFWFVYNFLSRAYGSSVGDLMTMVSIGTAIIRYDLPRKRKK